MATDKFIVITSIFEPTEAVKRYAEIDDWQLVVVGDKKSPRNWQLPNVTYLSAEDQAALSFETVKLLPWNHYCRKMIGYLYAISKGATIILDTDDDNIPLDNWVTYPFDGRHQLLDGQGYVNIYRYFTDEFVWPRGLPLKSILNPVAVDERETDAKVGVWQMLADEDPDVDAIYRLTSNKLINFKERDPLVLTKGLISPFNSQNTFFRKELFSLLYLPAFVTFRFTDILRGLVAQPIMWQAGYQLGIGKATVVQKRNEHDYLKDFESEVPVYLHAETVCKLAQESIDSSASVGKNLLNVYRALAKENLVTDQEVALLEAWQHDLEALR